jgi:hypothetical protein
MRRALTLLTAITATLAASTPVGAEPLGKLFFTPERRAALERQREFNIREAQPVESASVSLDGVVTRSSGRSTVWVNRRPQNENASGTGVNVAVSPKHPDRAVVTPNEEPPASLKVGESIDRATGEKVDLLDGGAVSVKPAASR